MTLNLRRPTPVGTYNKKVELQRLSDPPQRGTAGEKLRQYVVYQQIWGLVQPTFGSASVQGPIPGASQGYLVCLPYTLSLWETIKPEHRICWKEGTKDRILEIKTITNFDEANIEIRLQCIEVLA